MQPGSKRSLPNVPLPRDRHLHVGPARAFGHRRLHLRRHLVGHRAIGVAHVAGELRVLGEDARLVRPRDQAGHRGLALGRVVLPADVVDRDREHRRAHQRVAPAVHRRRPRVGGLAVDVHVHAARRVAAHHDAHRHRLAIEDRPLLDVQLEVGVDRAAAHRGLAVVADALELAAELLAVVVAQGEHPVHVEDAREGARGHHRRREARALLVGPAHQLERALGAHAPVVQRAQHLEAGQHADDAVVLAARELGVEVAAHQHRRQVIVRPGAPREDVADAVHRHRAARLGAPGDEEIAHLLVRVGEGQAAEAARLAGADLAGAHDGGPEARRVDGDRIGCGHGVRPPGALRSYRAAGEPVNRLDSRR